MDDRLPTVEPGPDAHGRDGFLVRTPFSEAFRDDLKARVPRESRRWAPELGRVWWVAREWWELLTTLLLEHFDGYGMVDPDTGAREDVTSEAGRDRQRMFFP